MKTVFLVFLIALTNHTLVGQDVAALNAANKSLTYDEAISFYTDLSNRYPNAKLTTAGLTDIGRPLHLFIISSDKSFDASVAHSKGKCVILINNGIHPGEADGIDASARLAKSLLDGSLKLPENVLIGIIPVYNVSGLLNSGCCTRANQDGPEVQGFRGTAQNLDLNRDFVKCDSENTRSFIKLFREWDPDVFIDTHVSNGADYQYTMTLISTQYNKLGAQAGHFLKHEMTPALFRNMSVAGHEMAPYVNTKKYGDSPETGIFGFNETPRYASGYAALFGTLSFVAETHMLKPFPQRVNATIKLFEIIVEYSSVNADQIKAARKQTKGSIRVKQDFVLNWEPDTTQFDIFPFRGYEIQKRISKVTGQEILFYDRDKPFVRPARFYDEYKPVLSVKRPQFYVLPQAWKEVVERMELNNVEMVRMLEDTVIEVETYVIEDFKTVMNPYEGRYLHHSVAVKTEMKKVQYYKGDFLIPVNQDCNRFIVETLEPQAPDSWFAWGFFDAILQQKEWFSAYVFDAHAEKMLNENAELRAEFEKNKEEDPEFASSNHAQLYFLYQRSEYFEDLKRYPVGRILR